MAEEAFKPWLFPSEDGHISVSDGAMEPLFGREMLESISNTGIWVGSKIGMLSIVVES